MKTTSTDAYQHALHLSRLIPLGHKHSEAKKQAVKRWHDQVIKMLANRCN